MRPAIVDVEGAAGHVDDALLHGPFQHPIGIDAFTAIQIGSILVAASASAIARPAFFAFAGGAAFGGAIGVASWPFALAGMVFLALLIVMVREDVRHQRRATRARRLAVSEQQRATLRAGWRTAVAAALAAATRT